MILIKRILGQAIVYLIKDKSELYYLQINF